MSNHSGRIGNWGSRVEGRQLVRNSRDGDNGDRRDKLRLLDCSNRKSDRPR